MKLAKTHHFTPVAIETGGSWNDLAIEFVTDLGTRIVAVTQEQRETAPRDPVYPEENIENVHILAEKTSSCISEHTPIRALIFSPLACLFHEDYHSFTIFKPLALC